MKRILLLAVLLAGCGEWDDSYTSPPDATQDPDADLPIDPGIEITDPPLDPGTESADLPPEMTPEPSPDPLPDPVEDTTPPSGVVGDPCSVTGDCMDVPGEGRLCLTVITTYFEYPNGYCSAACVSDGDCGTGAECLDMIFGSYCHKSCTSDVDCRESEGYHCSTFPEVTTDTYCFPTW
jgi:hypothetical protein